MNAEELEVGRRNLLAQLRSVDGPILVDDLMRRELVEVLEGLAPPTRDALADAIQASLYGSVAPDLAGEREECGKAADSVLNLMGGEKP